MQFSQTLPQMKNAASRSINKILQIYKILNSFNQKLENIKNEVLPNFKVKWENVLRKENEILVFERFYICRF